MTASLQCEPAQHSENGKALKGHIFKRKRVQDPYECRVFCYSELTCQSYNYVKTDQICELNNRTKEARPEDFVQDLTRFYMRRWKNRVSLGSIPEMPAESCEEIKASEQWMAVSGRYWLESLETKMKFKKFLVYCDMVSLDRAWTLLARFSNSDTKNWMNDSGYWWYDSTKAAGETADPSINVDMISPAFWLVSGSEFKITRSDDFGHTPLLHTTGNCLSGQTFRSKITSYGNFRNGSVWSDTKCLGKCKVQYGGQYLTTEGFGQASCNGELQAADEVGFWCDWRWSGSVIMIGGGGAVCSRADHGIGTTVAKLASFEIKENGRRESDFSNDAWGQITKNCSLNLWIC
ncbi:uncharacterized protein LOC111341251 [Stylophora pistillata]|uniref:uncharacterized protein LOC111341251 n=1 Tax=Stylophora pistillata TaxID=50429 RepID=UPI000C03CE9B|nr:uncharacterized protein LOC111341251 [Stylophora pistillata]